MTKQSRTIRISEESWRALSKYAKGFETPDTALQRLLGLDIACPACGECDHDRLMWVWSKKNEPTGELHCACGQVFTPQ